VNECTRANAGLGYATYLRLKISRVVDGFANAICAICNYPDESNHALIVRQAIRAWAETQGLFEGLGRDAQADPCADSDDRPRDADQPIEPSERQIAFLKAFDLGYMRRRLRFVVAAFNWWYRCADRPGFPTREDLDRCKAVTYEAIRRIDLLAQLQLGDEQDPNASRQAEALREQVRRTFAEGTVHDFLDKHSAHGEQYAAEHAADLDALHSATEAFLNAQLAGFAPSLLAQFAELTQTWTPQRQRDLVVRYLGFPLWDILIYPIQSLGQVGERDQIDVIRISPREATVLTPPAAGKVQGVRQHHFYAFFSRKARENDYLWGRLDAAEQLIRLLLDTTKSNESLQRWCKQSFDAILKEETAAQALPSISETVKELGDQVDAL
jgi:hypothetical protein